MRRIDVRAVVALGALFAATANAQGPTRAAAIPGTLVIRVRVVDTASQPVRGATVTARRGATTLAERVTDDDGKGDLTLPRGGAVVVAARRVGFAPDSAVISPAGDSIVATTIMLGRPVQRLAPLAVTAREDELRRRTHLSADDIAHSSRVVFDGLDAIVKLRPDMIDPPESTPLAPCGLFHLWVNGRRVPLPQDSVPIDDPMVGSRLATMKPKPLPWVALALSTIKPEDIEEVTYRGCNDATMDGVAQRNAAFVVLKPGIGFDLSRGSYRITDDETAAGRIARRQRERADSGAHAAVPAIAWYRRRLLGVYDAATGAPVVSAAVRDLSSGLTALTTATGTVSLVFLPEGHSTIRIGKQGFEPLALGVDISPADTVPLTLVLTRAK